MQTTSDSPRPKRTASKPRVADGATVTVKKKSRARKSTPAEAAPSVLDLEPAAVSSPMTPMDLTTQIAEAAYFLAEERGFAPGHELDDWLEAERRIRAALDARAGLS
jgi:hypothetical protein